MLWWGGHQDIRKIWHCIYGRHGLGWLRKQKNCSQTLKLVIVVFGREPATSEIFGSLCKDRVKSTPERTMLTVARLTLGLEPPTSFFLISSSFYSLSVGGLDRVVCLLGFCFFGFFFFFIHIPVWPLIWQLLTLGTIFMIFLWEMEVLTWRTKYHLFPGEDNVGQGLRDRFCL